MVEVPVFSRIFSLPPCPLISFLALDAPSGPHSHSKIKRLEKNNKSCGV
jgi:hypothetical protein